MASAAQIRERLAGLAGELLVAATDEWLRPKTRSAYACYAPFISEMSKQPEFCEMLAKIDAGGSDEAVDQALDEVLTRWPVPRTGVYERQNWLRLLRAVVQDDLTIIRPTTVNEVTGGTMVDVLFVYDSLYVYKDMREGYFFGPCRPMIEAARRFVFWGTQAQVRRRLKTAIDKPLEAFVERLREFMRGEGLSADNLPSFTVLVLTDLGHRRDQQDLDMVSEQHRHGECHESFQVPWSRSGIDDVLDAILDRLPEVFSDGRGRPPRREDYARWWADRVFRRMSVREIAKEESARRGFVLKTDNIEKFDDEDEAADAEIDKTIPRLRTAFFGWG